MLKFRMEKRVLIIEDSQSIAELEKRHLERDGFSVELAGTGGKALDIIRRDDAIDVLIIDYRLPDMSGVDLMQMVKEMGRDIPSIIVTAAGNENVAVAAMKLGAMDYVVKDKETIKKLPETCREVLRRFDLVAENARLLEELRLVNTELAETNRRLEDISKRDYLTGVFNRRYIMETLSFEVSRSERYRNPISVAIFDLDRFKKINDRHGHSTGDLVLKQFAGLLKKRIRKTDVFGRYGGEEFVIIITDTTLDKSMILCEELRAVVEAGSFGEEHLSLKVTTSAGVAALVDGMDARGLVDMADRGLYRAKQEGRNRVVSLQDEDAGLGGVKAG